MKKKLKRGINRISKKNNILKSLIITVFLVIILFIIFVFLFNIFYKKEKYHLKEELPSLGIFGGGSGSIEDPYIISNCQELQDINKDPFSNYILVNNIDCSDTINWNNGAGFQSIGEYYWDNVAKKYVDRKFNGTLDGNGFNITNLYGEGIFSYLKGKIKNVHLVNINVSGGGSLVNVNEGVIENCSSIGNVSQGGNYEFGTIYADCLELNNLIRISFREGTGGLVGFNIGNISNSYFYGVVKGFIQVGGLVGVNNGNIINSYSNVDIYGDYNAGGLAGLSVARNKWKDGIYNSFSVGNIYGSFSSGGLVGVSNSIVINNSFFSGNVWGDFNSGGIVGYRGDSCYSFIYNSFYYNETGDVNWCWSNSSGSFNDGCTIVNDKNYFYNFENEPMIYWNFVEDWSKDNIHEGYPKLKWENSFLVYCGDNICNNMENCLTCSQDCGSCRKEEDNKISNEFSSVGDSKKEYWIKSIYINDSQLKEGFENELLTRHRIVFKISNKTYFIGVTDIFFNYAKINLSLNRMLTYYFFIGDDKKFDIDNNQLYVKMNYLDKSKVKIFVKYTPKSNNQDSDKINESETIKNESKQQSVEVPYESEEETPWILYIAVLVLIILVIGIIFEVYLFLNAKRKIKEFRKRAISIYKYKNKNKNI
ncbi:MAG: hypothetical protein QXW97_01860 [Candidatus Pacearchaeota archaeon]